MLPGRLVHVPCAAPGRGSDRRGPQGDLRDPGELRLYAVIYVTVEESNNDAVVFATAMVHRRDGRLGCAVWGPLLLSAVLGIWRGLLRITTRTYPTYGYGASYNPWTGAYTRGAVAYGPYGGAGMAQRYNPRTGTYSRGAVAYGPYGSRGAASAYNPRTGTAAATRQGSNVYGSWGTTGVARGDDWAKTSRYTSNVTGNTTRVTKTSNGDVYAGRDGNVTQRGDNHQSLAATRMEQCRSREFRHHCRAHTKRARATTSGMDPSTRSVTRDPRRVPARSAPAIPATRGGRGELAAIVERRTAGGGGPALTKNHHGGH